MLDLLFSVIVVSLCVTFFRKTLEKWKIEELYVKYAPKFFPEELCYWCLHFWLSVITSFIVMVSFSTGLVTALFSVLISAVIAHKIFEWEQ